MWGGVTGGLLKIIKLDHSYFPKASYLEGA